MINVLMYLHRQLEISIETNKTNTTLSQIEN